MHGYYRLLWRHVVPPLGPALSATTFLLGSVRLLFGQHAEGNLGYLGSVAISAILLGLVLGYCWLLYDRAVTALFREAVECFTPRFFRYHEIRGVRSPDQHPQWRTRHRVVLLHWRYLRSSPAVQETFMQLLADSGILFELDFDLFWLAREVATPTLAVA